MTDILLFSYHPISKYVSFHERSHYNKGEREEKELQDVDSEIM